ncbi:hypothetical protein ACFL6L_01030 [candidate division KSB1 bacterium]
METIFIVFCVILITCISLIFGIMINIRAIMKRIHGQLQRLDTKLEYVPFPRNQLLNLERFAQKLKKIVWGIRSIKPGEDK